MLSRDFSVATRSAVSRRVNWLIWSTIVEIFGEVDAAVEVEDCHLRCKVEDVRGRDLRVEVGTARQAHRQDCEIRRGTGDMVGGVGGRRVGGLGDGRGLTLMLMLSMVRGLRPKDMKVHLAHASLILVLELFSLFILTTTTTTPSPPRQDGLLWRGSRAASRRQ